MARWREGVPLESGLKLDINRLIRDEPVQQMMRKIVVWVALLYGIYSLFSYFNPEQIDAFYYPNRSDLTKHIEVKGLKSVEACREAVRNIAKSHGDPDLIKGDYECGIGFKQKLGDVNVYRETVR